MKKTNYIVLFILLFYSLTTKEQIIGTNLVQNPSFEEYNNCPFWLGQLYESKYWWGASSDYFNACASMYVSVPSNYEGFQYAHTGVAYAGFDIYANNLTLDPDYREAIKAKLSDSLITKKRYCTNFYISLSEYSYTFMQNAYVLLDSIGLLFTNNSVQDSIVPILSNGIKVQNGIFNIDTVNWFKIPNTFIANGGEQYLTIGNFDNIIKWPSGAIGQVYVLIDDVSVCECSFNFSLGNDTTLCIGESLILNSNLPNAIFTWQDGSHDSTFKVTQAGTYWVSAYFVDYNITTYDTIKVAYINCDTVETIIPDIYIPNSFTPNGDGLNDIFNIKTLYEFSDYKLTIFNRWGDMVFDSDDVNKGWDGTYKGKFVTYGVYVYQLTATIKDTGEQRKITGRVTVVR